jgi:hypothetical protein
MGAYTVLGSVRPQANGFWTMTLFPRATLVFLTLLISVPSVPAFAQFDLGGHWARRSNQDDMESGPGPDPVDYLGLPLNDEGRARGLTFQYSAVSLPEHQCGYLSPFYIVLGPFGLAIDRVLDPVTGRLIAWKIGGWVDRDVTTIWMDGRPHPGEHAPHTSGGFTTGMWEGDTLTTSTTHIKAGMIRRNGAPLSDRATMTMHFTRHGDLLTARAMIEDPIYLSEPYVRSRVWQLDPSANFGNGVASPCEPIDELPRAENGDVFPHHLPGTNPFVNELTRYYNLPQEAVLGGPQTMYPEFRKKLVGYEPPALCKRYCGCGGLGVACITDGSGVPQGGR